MKTHKFLICLFLISRATCSEADEEALFESVDVKVRCNCDKDFVIDHLGAGWIKQLRIPPPPEKIVVIKQETDSEGK